MIGRRAWKALIIAMSSRWLMWSNISCFIPRPWILWLRWCTPHPDGLASVVTCSRLKGSEWTSDLEIWHENPPSDWAASSGVTRRLISWWSVTGSNSKRYHDWSDLSLSLACCTTDVVDTISWRRCWTWWAVTRARSWNGQISFFSFLNFFAGMNTLACAESRRAQM